MRLARQFFMSCALAGALFALPQLSLCASSNHPSHYVGTFESVPPGKGKPGPMMSVSLGRDGTATLTQDWGKGAKTWFGKWSDEGGQIKLTFEDIPGQPNEPPMLFESSHGGLKAVTWDRAKWGKVTPPLMKRHNHNWHADDHQGFW